MNNRVSLLGRVVGAPVYHCTTEARDLLRFSLRVVDAYHPDSFFPQECVIWGGPALGLAACLQSGDCVLVRGALRYRRESSRRPYVEIRRYVLLGGVAGKAVSLADAHEHAE